jgi:hypothetical protein
VLWVLIELREPDVDHFSLVGLQLSWRKKFAGSCVF